MQTFSRPYGTQTTRTKETANGVVGARVPALKGGAKVRRPSGADSHGNNSYSQNNNIVTIVINGTSRISTIPRADAWG